MEYFSQLTKLSQGVRRLGSADWTWAYVATGRWTDTGKPVKSGGYRCGCTHCPGAGGRVNKLNGDIDYLTPPNSIIASNLPSHARLMAELNHVK